MATVKKSKSKVIVPICIVLVIAIVSGTIFGVTKSHKGEEVSLYSINNDDIIETVSLTGEVSAGTTKEYKVSTSAVVKEVFVKLGDEVKQNDLLATFDMTQLDGQVKSLQTSYNDALTSYNSAVKKQSDAQYKSNALEGEISSLEAKIEKLQKESASATAATNTSTTASAASTTASAASTTTTNRASNESTNNRTSSNGANVAVNYASTASTSDIGNDVTNITTQIEELNQTLTNLTLTLEQLLETTTIIADDLALLTAFVENFDMDEFTQKLVDDLVASGLGERIAHEIVASIDFEALANTLVNANSTQLTAAQIQLLTLEGQYAIYSAQADGTIVSAQKKALNATKQALDIVKAQQKELSEGWKASFDGTITSVDVYPGAQTNVLTTGITLENLDTMAVTVSLSEYDVHKVRVGMPATVTTAYGTYEAEVTSIAPTATGGSSSSILDNVGSMAGISGLSSLTDSGAGVQCIVSIAKTDENIIAGFDADVEIVTGEYLGVTTVPIESIKLEKTGSYVYLYNEEENTVTKTLIETGAVSDTAYEVKSGITVGDRIVAAPAADYEEDTFKVKVVTK